jgi:hypothetical protein
MTGADGVPAPRRPPDDQQPSLSQVIHSSQGQGVLSRFDPYRACFVAPAIKALKVNVVTSGQKAWTKTPDTEHGMNARRQRV